MRKSLKKLSLSLEYVASSLPRISAMTMGRLARCINRRKIAYRGGSSVRGLFERREKGVPKCFQQFTSHIWGCSSSRQSFNCKQSTTPCANYRDDVALTRCAARHIASAALDASPLSAYPKKHKFSGKSTVYRPIRTALLTKFTLLGTFINP